MIRRKCSACQRLPSGALAGLPIRRPAEDNAGTPRQTPEGEQLRRKFGGKRLISQAQARTDWLLNGALDEETQGEFVVEQ